MKIGDYVKLAMDAAGRGEDELALLLACAAVDGTAAKRYPNIRDNGDRFRRFLRDGAGALGPMAFPGFDILTQEFPVALDAKSVVKRDAAFLIYKYYRCAVAHGDEFDPGFGLIDDTRSGSGSTRFEISPHSGSARLSNRLIWGLLACTVFAPENAEERVPDGYYFLYGGQVTMMVNDFWGSGDRFEVSIAPLSPLPVVRMDFNEWLA